MIVSLIILASVVASKLAVRFGVPALLLFILIGMGIGSEGFGGVEFDNPKLTQSVGVVALVFVLFSGGLDTHWRDVQTVAKESLLLSTLGVGITALSIGWLAHMFLEFTWEGGILLGATMASTDAAAVFSVLRGKNVNLKGKLKSILEVESGSNDPMAVFLTLGMIELLNANNAQAIDLLPLFIIQMTVGVLMGVIVGSLMLFAINHLRLEHDGLYPALTMGFVLLCYGLTSSLDGNGFLAIYITGLVVGRKDFIHKNSLQDFHDGLAWLMQITMFILLGLQVFPSRLFDVAGEGLFIAIFVILAARPLSVFIVLFPLRISVEEKLFISWVGLRGAAPIILATFSQIADVRLPVPIFDLVFFVVLISVSLQGTTIVPVARWLGVYEAEKPQKTLLTQIKQGSKINDYLFEINVPKHSAIIGKQIINLDLPTGALIVLITRESEIIVPQGHTVMEDNDQILILATKTQHSFIHDLFTTITERE
jgi:cell volume regulation protein A